MIVIDETVGAAFDIQSVDLDGDGVEDILVTNHQSGKKGTPPSVFAYHVVKPEAAPRTPGLVLNYGDNDQEAGFDRPTSVSDFMNGLQFTRRTLSSNFTIVNRSFMAAGPGAAKAVRVHADPSHPANKYPTIVVSGDGTEKAYLLSRTENNVWEYAHEQFHDCSGTVGGILTRDLDNDGWQEVVVPCYDKDYVAIYTFAPEQ